MMNGRPMAGCAPPANGITCTATFGSAACASRCSSCSRIRPAPPTRRRSAASSSTAQIFGGSSRVTAGWRAIRSATLRSTSSLGLFIIPALITALA